MTSLGSVRSLRFLLGRRWVLLALVVAVLAYATWWLGGWQFDRLEERRDGNAEVRANEGRDPAAVGTVLAPGKRVSAGEEWRVVEARGRYAPEDSVIVRYRTRQGAPGVDVVVPLVTEAGPALLVDRGWVPAAAAGGAPVDVPEPPAGEVTITGYARADGTGDSTEVVDAQTRAVSSQEIGPALGREVYGGFVELRSEDPAPAEALTPVELPDLDDGPHFFYGLQWWFFGMLAIGGFGYLVYDEWRRTTGRGSRRRRPVEERASEPGG